MNGDELRVILAEIGLSQADFARLIAVTPRAVTLWLSGERAIPGPVEGYLRLFRQLPQSHRQAEVSRIRQKGTTMREGMYGISFQANGDFGLGVLVLESGRVYGADAATVKYDGDYTFDETTGLATIKLKVTFPPNVRAVFGISNPYEWSFDVLTTLDPKKPTGSLAIETSIGKPLTAQYTFLRSLPEAA